MTEKSDFIKINVIFEINMQALRIFNQQIGELADLHDAGVLKNLIQSFSNITEIDFNSMNTEGLPENDDHHGSSSATTDETHIGSNKTRSITPSLKQEITQKILDVAKDPEKSKAILEMAFATTKQAPMQGSLLRRGALVTLFSFLESLISEMIHKFYQLFPAALPAEDRMLSLADLKSIGSVEDAEKYLIAREVESILRESLESQIEYFKKRFKIDLSALDMHFNDLIELSQRRNILVHNNGIVNSFYLSRVSCEYISNNEINEGQVLLVSRIYLENAIDTIQYCGIVLAHHCWRKWVKDEIDDSDSLIFHTVYDALVEKRYELVIKLSELSSKLSYKSDERTRMALINHAIALKELNKVDDMRELLNSKDWSSCALKFQLALFVLNDDDGKFYEFLPKAVAAGEIEREALLKWPLFRQMRENEKFQDQINKLF